jgi:copper chaperone CopZ
MLRLLTAAMALAASPALADHKGAHGGAQKHEAQGAAHETTDSAAKLDAAIAAGGELIVVDVLGVVCDFCAAAMNKTFGKRAEVAATEVDLDAKTLTLVFKPGRALDDAAITELVKKAGYTIAAVHRGDAAKAKRAGAQAAADDAQE